MNNKFELYKNRFYSFVMKSKECNIYTKCKNKKGYGVFNNPYERMAHRFSWFIHHGNIPSGVLVLHRCDNPACVKIEHLYLGTAQDNTNDMMLKGRHKLPSIPLKGENNPQSKITEPIAQKIATLLSSGMTSPMIAESLNISRYIIDDIRSKRTWKHLKFEIPKILPFLKTCLTCKKEFKAPLCLREKQKYCDANCYWNKTTKKHLIEDRKRISLDIPRYIFDVMNEVCISRNMTLTRYIISAIKMKYNYEINPDNTNSI